jgi:rhodanese-related sulfurtransferase
LPADRDLVLVCHHGNRSQHAAMWLRQHGCAKLHNLRGGVEAWALDVEPAMPRY